MKSMLSRTTIGAVLALSTASGAFAQDLCGGIGGAGQWIGGTQAASDIATTGSYQEQMALVLGGNEYVALFDLSAPSDVRIEAAGRGSGDPIIDIYDGAGAIVTSDDDSGGNGAARAEVSLDAGTYCVAMRSFDAVPMTGFVRVGRSEHEALTTGMNDAPPPDTTPPAGGNGDYPPPGGVCDGSTPAAPVEIGTPVYGSVNDVPYWRFTIDTPMPIAITAENSDADPYITLYDGSGNYISENDDWDGLNSRIELTYPLDPGSYCVAMTALSDNFQPITLTVSEFDAEQALIAMYDAGEAAPPMDGSYPIEELGELATRLRVDLQNSGTATWHSLDLYEGGLLLAEAISTDGNGDPFLVLYDDLGREVAYNDDYDGLNPMLTAKVNPGTYLLAVGDYGGTTGPVRMLIQRYVPAR